MMGTYAIIANGIVVNIILWDGESDWAPQDGQIAVPVPDDVFVDISYVFDGGVFSPPN